MKVALVVGHSARSQGARRALTGVSEYAFNCKVAALVQQSPIPEVEIQVFYRTDAAYTEAMAEIVGRINEENPDIVVSLHFNGCSFPNVQRAEIIHCEGSDAGRNAAGLVLRSWRPFCREHGVRIVSRWHSWSGKELHILTDTLAPALILEPFYGSGAGEEAYTTENVAGMVCVALQALSVRTW